MSKEFLEQKAGDLLDASRVLVSVVAGSLRKQYPHVFSASVYERLNLFGTVACVWTACVRLHFDVAKQLRTPLELVVQRGLAQWNPEAIGAFEALHSAVDEDLIEIKRQLREDQLFKLAARWAVEMAAGGLLSPEHERIVERLAQLFCEETAGYWRVTQLSSQRTNSPQSAAHHSQPTMVQNKEEMLVRIANCGAISFYTPMVQKFPELARLKNIKNWDFFVTSATVASAVFHLQVVLGADEVHAIQQRMAQELVRIHPQAWDAVHDLVRFIDRGKKPQMPSGQAGAQEIASLFREIHEGMGCAIGGWVVWNLKGDMPAEVDLPLLSAIGRFCYEGLGRELIVDLAKQAS